MARLRTPPTPTGYAILVVDDNEEYLVAAERILARCGHSVVAMTNPVEALARLRETRFDLVLVDFFMPEMTGEVFVRELRGFDPVTHVILQTGYASEMPPRELVQRLDIQGYYDKSEGPDKLLLWADVGLKAARVVQRLDRERRALRHIVTAGMELHRRAEPKELFSTILARTRDLFGILAPPTAPTGDAPTPEPAVFVATGEDARELFVRAGTGRFRESRRPSEGLGADAMAGLTLALSEASVSSGEWGTAAPLVLDGTALGVLFVERALPETGDAALLRAFADHVALAAHDLERPA